MNFRTQIWCDIFYPITKNQPVIAKIEKIIILIPLGIESRTMEHIHKCLSLGENGDISHNPSDPFVGGYELAVMS